jgi:hypothetical protein
MKRILPSNYFKLLKSYLHESQFEAKLNGEISSHFHIHSGVLKWSIRGSLIYLLYTSDLPTSRENTLGTFTDDSAIFSTHEDSTIASLNLQEPCVLYTGRAYRYPPDVTFYICILK